jgi:hypothetical protein
MILLKGSLGEPLVYFLISPKHRTFHFSFYVFKGLGTGTSSQTLFGNLKKKLRFNKIRQIKQNLFFHLGIGNNN